MIASKVIPLVDLTLLSDDCDEQKVGDLCATGLSRNVASICIYGQFVSEAKRLLQDSAVQIATVCNFPFGRQPLEKTLSEINEALLEGANEIDVAMPYEDYLSGERSKVIHYIESCRQACPDPVILKVILETGAFNSSDLVYLAAKDMIHAGADFIKTSTGKIETGATLGSAAAILRAIQETQSQEKTAGIKLSGGIRTLTDLSPYIELIEEQMGKNWMTPYTVRIGTSQLLEQIYATC